MDLQTLALIFLVTVAAGGLVWVFVYPILSGEQQAERRVQNVGRSEPAARAAPQRGAPRSRREQVEDSLKQLEVKQSKAKRLPLSMKINQAGLTWSKQQFMIISAIMGLFAFAGSFFVGAGLFPALAIGFAGGLGVPQWLLSYLRKRRESR